MVIELRDYPSHETLETLSRRFPELDITAAQTWLSLLRVSSNVVAYFEDYLSDYKLSRSKFFVLILLMRNPNGLNISQLAEGTGVSSATMTGLVERLKKSGLVTREELPQDRRVLIVRMTQQGEQLLEKVLPDHYTRIAELMSKLDEDERKLLQKLLEQVNAGLPTDF
jgi:DNA-binding MarR family transcriptional regulator